MKHGMHGTPTYQAWNRMRARGEPVCEEWQTFDAFWRDMKTKPQGEAITRIDPTLPYSKENCIWAVPKGQQEHRKDRCYLTYQGETKTLVEWQKDYNLPYGILYKRIHQGWDTERALTQRPMKKGEW